MKIGIHQPNFLPWYPFFQKINDVDIFIILKEPQFEKNNFQNRFSLNDEWYTMSVHKGMMPIKNKEYFNPQEDWEQIKKSYIIMKTFFLSLMNLLLIICLKRIIR